MPTDKVKLLGVTLDNLGSMCISPTKQARRAQDEGTAAQTQSAVLQVADHGSPVWYPIATHEMKQLLLQSQRTTAQAVIRGFRTVALSVAEVEAGLLPMEQRSR